MKKRNNKKNEPWYVNVSNEKLARVIKLLKEDKKFFAMFAGLLSLVLIIGSTFAWSSYSSWVKNHLQSETGVLDVRISETFKQDSVLFSNEKTEKKVNVRNNSDKLAIIRVKLDESTALFKLDGQTGSLKTKKEEPTDKVLEREKVDTWESGSIYPIEPSNQDFHVVKKVIKDEKFIYDKPANRKNELQKFVLEFSPALDTSTKPGNKTPYWVYEDGYFYYSKVLKENETTEVPLLENVAVLGDTQKNSHKNQLYNLDITALGIIANNKSLKDWNVSVDVKSMYEEDELFEK